MIFVITAATLLASTVSAAEDPSPERQEQLQRLAERRRADRGHRAVARASRAARERASERARLEYAARMAPVLAAREAAMRRDMLEEQRLRAQTAAAIWQAQAQQRLAAAITYEAYVAAGRRYRYP